MSKALNPLASKTLINLWSPSQATEAVLHWIIQFEIVTRKHISGWLASVSDFPEILCNMEIEKIEFDNNRNDAAEFLGEPFTHGYFFRIEFAEELNSHELQNLCLAISGNGKAQTVEPIFCTYAVDNAAAATNEEICFAIEKFGLFSQPYYESAAGVRFKTQREAILHCISDNSNPDPHPMFNGKYYLKNNRDVSNSGTHPLTHYIFFGHQEDRRTTNELDWEYYKNLHGTAIPAKISTLHHYIRVGALCRSSPLPWLDSAAIAKIPRLEVYPQLAFKRGSYKDVPLSALNEGSKVTSPTPGTGPGIDVIISFYKEPYLIALQKYSLLQHVQEFSALNVRLILICDSPADEMAVAEFNSLVTAVKDEIETISLINDENIGFVHSINRGLRLSASAKRHALLFNSDAFFTTGSVIEMLRALESDPMLAFVAPRSNNATICTFGEGKNSWEKELERFKTLREHLPQITFTPTVVGFCLLIKNTILNEFGFLDTAYGRGYNEENDLIMRANRFGYRSALANWSYVFHIGGQSFNETEFASCSNEDVINNRYPEYRKAIARYFSGRDRFLESRVTGIIDNNNSRKLLIDLSSIGPYTNGTSFYSVRLIQALAELRSGFAITLLCTPAAKEYHSLSHIPNVAITHDWPDGRSIDTSFAAVLRVGQPFESKLIASALRCSYVYSCFMLDPIAFDCHYLWDQQRQTTWETFYELADGAIYQSEFTKKLFDNRFGKYSNISNLTSYHSLDVDEYSLPGETRVTWMNHALPRKSYIFIIGNHFYHKDIDRAYQAIASQFREMNIVVLGGKQQTLSAGHRNSYFLQSGEVADSDIKYLYENAAALVFPSHYEGFGIPLLHAAHLGIPFVCRNSDLVGDLSKRIGFAPHTYLNLDEICITIERALEDGAERPASRNTHNWAASAQEVAEFLHNLIDDQEISKIFKKYSYLEHARRTPNH
jgi:glycosyltransferase involved in cell wall biosynthesis